ncbi:uncharacterized protein LOC111987393 isoform X2 [Quercus suber]|uniref:uncharacterized protein LOC111987393 isoform X2 n=1 Tax=Quercus suber TaxID=58331 RepID=UPI000CE1DB48|nr:GPI mannosyltransferase 2 isoform X2 [Quercus suber]
MTTTAAATATAFPTNQQHKTLVLKSAILSRLLLLTLILIWRSLLTPYDTSAPLNPSCLKIAKDQNSDSAAVLFPKLASAIENGIVWDSVYFVRSAQCAAYEYEQSYAFLPLLPLFISFLSHTVIILKDSELALRASILFCFNPASIFYSSIYSESLYALFSFGGLYYLVTGGNTVAVVSFALSGCARSNGVLNAGYFCFQTMHHAYDALFLKKRAFLTIQVLTAGALRCICILTPFFAFQAYGYYNICLGHDLHEMRPWCKARVPLLYNFIQSHYWGVGFLRYFQLKQLPNFLLASPILSLAVCSIIYYAKSRPGIFFSLGFQASIEEKNSSALLFSLESVPRSNIARLPEKSYSKIQENHNLRQRKHTNRVDPVALPIENDPLAKLGYLSISVLPFILQLGFMAATAFFVMHVQVATRFLSASPPLYWFASHLMVHPGSKRWAYLIWAYSAAYILLGSLLFSNFYPFT